MWNPHDGEDENRLKALKGKNADSRLTYTQYYSKKLQSGLATFFAEKKVALESKMNVSYITQPKCCAKYFDGKLQHVTLHHVRNKVKR